MRDNLVSEWLGLFSDMFKWVEVQERWVNTAHNNVQSTNYKLSKMSYFQIKDQPSQLRKSYLVNNWKGLVLCEKKFMLFSRQPSSYYKL
jgi:hypothetical protein